MLNIEDFNYNLPQELIAKYPPKERGTTNLLVLDRSNKEITKKKYFNLLDYINPGDIVVLNKTKVQNVRTFPIVNRTGKQVEVLFLENVQYKEKDSLADEYWYALIGRAKNIEIGDTLNFESGEQVIVIHRDKGEPGFIIKFPKGLTSTKLFNKYGHVPLPPYMKRPDEESDKKRYNTVFAEYLGSVAAPTASLNLTKAILNSIKEKGAEIVYIELKIGWGTFAPINTEKVEDFKLHSEKYNLPKSVADKIIQTKKRGGKVWAFGTTVTRVLESCAIKNNNKVELKSGEGETNIFIYPGYEWKIVDHLVTNFHVPKSTLLMLVSSFAGREFVMEAYKQAVESEFQFLSYGDSMLIL